MLSIIFEHLHFVQLCLLVTGEPCSHVSIFYKLYFFQLNFHIFCFSFETCKGMTLDGTCWDVLSWEFWQLQWVLMFVSIFFFFLLWDEDLKHPCYLFWQTPFSPWDKVSMTIFRSNKYSRYLLLKRRSILLRIVLLAHDYHHLTNACPKLLWKV